MSHSGEITYEERKVIQLEAVHHRVSRYGQIYGVILESFDHQFYTLGDCNCETLYEVFKLTHGEHIVLEKIWSESDNTLYLVEEADFDIDPRVYPLCQCCGGRITEVLGSLVCPNTRCEGRSHNRLAYFFSKIPIFPEAEDIAAFVAHDVTDDLSSNVSTISSALYTISMCQDEDWLHPAKVVLFDILFRMHKAAIALNTHDAPMEGLVLADFIMAMSIPCIQLRDISDGIICMQERMEVQSIFSYIADLCLERGGDPQGLYQSDLRAVEEYVLLAEKPMNSRDASLWE